MLMNKNCEIAWTWFILCLEQRALTFHLQKQFTCMHIWMELKAKIGRQKERDRGRVCSLHIYRNVQKCTRRFYRTKIVFLGVLFLLFVQNNLKHSMWWLQSIKKLNTNKKHRNENYALGSIHLCGERERKENQKKECVTHFR